ncbi:MAG: hypothetical protein AAGH38_06220 [Pseudomonadota bacterium]
MRRSLAFSALHPIDHFVLSKLEVEHMQNAGQENGNLILTFSNLQEAGLKSKRDISRSIKRLEALGFIEVIRSGYVKPAGRRPPSRYRLTYLRRVEGNTVGGHTEAYPATNDWKHFNTPEKVYGALAPIKERPFNERRDRVQNASRSAAARTGGIPQNIEGGSNTAPKNRPKTPAKHLPEDSLGSLSAPKTAISVPIRNQRKKPSGDPTAADQSPAA